MGVLNWITQGCDALTTAASPTIDAMGLRICIALATIMLVWFGVQEALASTHHGAGFNVGKFLSFFMLITFAYTLVKFYDTSIPGIGQSFRGFINGGAQNLVNVIGTDSMTSIQNTLNQAQSTEAQWVSEFIGKVEIERMRETHFDGSRSGRNFALDRQEEPLVMESEISGLEDLHAFLKHANFVTRFSFPYLDVPSTKTQFEPRELPGEKLDFDPKTLRKLDAPEPAPEQNAKQDETHEKQTTVTTY